MDCPEDGGSELFRNAAHCSPIDTVSYSRRLQSSCGLVFSPREMLEIIWYMLLYKSRIGDGENTRNLPLAESERALSYADVSGVTGNDKDYIMRCSVHLRVRYAYIFRGY